MQATDEDAAAGRAPRHRPDEIQAYYRDPAVVAAYIERRTAQPLNGMLHRHQVRFLTRVLGERQPRRVLEVAPGPARLTTELAFRGNGIAVDGSAEMLAMARDRLRGEGHWLVVRGDAFALPVADA